MNIKQKSSISSCDIIIVPFFEDKKISTNDITKIIPEAKESLEIAIKNKDFTGKKKETLLLYTASKKCSRVLLCGLGKKNNHTEIIRKAGGIAYKNLSKYSPKKISILTQKNFQEAELIQAFIEGINLASYNFTTFKTSQQKKTPEIKIEIIAPNKKKDIIENMQKINSICQGIKHTRDLVNTPPNKLVPNDLANECKKLSKENRNIKTTILDEKKLKKLGCEAILAVGQGSVHPPRIAFMHYKSKVKKAPTIAIVGKGITFDTGGVNLKPTSGVRDMKMDMGGAATVLGLFKILAQKENLPVNVIGVVSTAENSISAKAYRPGDIIGSHAGKTIEVSNTDAEGRLILADALSYTTQKYKPDYIIDLATLTGACLVALGNNISGLIGTSDTLIEKIKEASKNTDEKVWQLPLDEDIVNSVKGTISDYINWVGSVRAGTIMAAAFLSYFVNDTPWAHFDIAGTAWTSTGNEYTSKGGTGKTVKLLWNLLENFQNA